MEEESIVLFDGRGNHSAEIFNQTRTEKKLSDLFEFNVGIQG